MQCNRCTPASSRFPGPGQGTAIKAYRVVPQVRSIFPCSAQEKSPTMKFVIVLFAVMAVASAYPGIIPYSAPVDPWPAPAPQYVPVKVAAPPPSYIKVEQPSSYYKVVSSPLVKVQVPQVHAPEVHQVLQIPQQQSIPPPHPQPLNIKIPHISSVKIPYASPKIAHPHLIGVEQYVEPVKIVKAPISHHPWD
ncbi:hypothetical protein ANTQUA_LOCUS6862 [Anthophora quadrimaculata]